MVEQVADMDLMVRIDVLKRLKKYVFVPIFMLAITIKNEFA